MSPFLLYPPLTSCQVSEKSNVGKYDNFDLTDGRTHTRTFWLPGLNWSWELQRAWTHESQLQKFELDFFDYLTSWLDTLQCIKLIIRSNFISQTYYLVHIILVFSLIMFKFYGQKPLFWPFGSFKNAFLWSLNDPSWPGNIAESWKTSSSITLCNIKSMQQTKL